jgi:hypothetical protein
MTPLETIDAELTTVRDRYLRAVWDWNFMAAQVEARRIDDLLDARRKAALLASAR